jgi:fucose permease
MVLVFGVLGIAYAFVDTSLYTYGVSQFPGRKRVIIMFLQFCFGLGALSYAQLAMWLADDFASHGVVFWGLAMLLAGPACILAVRRDGDSQKISQSRAVTTAGLLSKWQGVALLCLVMFFYMGSQVTTLLWVPELLHQQYSHSFSNTNKIISLFWVGTLLGRLLFSLVLDKRGESRTLLFVFVLAGSILSWSMCILSVPIFLRSIILFLIGLTTAGIYPLILDLGLSLVPSASGMITAVLMGGAQLGNAFFSKASASVVSNFGWLLGVLIPGMLLSLAALALLLGHNQLGTVQEADKPSSTGFSNDH